MSSGLTISSNSSSRNAHWRNDNAMSHGESDVTGAADGAPSGCLRYGIPFRSAWSLSYRMFTPITLTPITSCPGSFKSSRLKSAIPSVFS
jgi:hypothetical protein